MIRKLYFLIFFIAFTSVLQSQTKNDFKQSFVLGIGGGPTFNRFFFTPSVKQHTLNAYWGGLILRYDVESYASLQMEVNYSKSGWQERFGNEDKKIRSYKRELQYVRLPILSNIHYNINRYSIFFTAGPEFGYQIKENFLEQGKENMSELELLRHSMPTTKKISWGLTGGLGLGVVFGRNHIELEGRYTYGFGDIWSTKRSDPYGKASESIIGIRLNYLITIN